MGTEETLPIAVVNSQNWCRDRLAKYEEALRARPKTAHHKTLIRDYERNLGYVREFAPGWKPEAIDRGGFGD